MRTGSARVASHTSRTFRTALFRVRVSHLSKVHGITDHDERTFIAVLVRQVFHLERAVALPRLEDRLPLLVGWILGNIVSVMFGSAIAAFCFWIGDGGMILTWIRRSETSCD